MQLKENCKSCTTRLSQTPLVLSRYLSEIYGHLHFSYAKRFTHTLIISQLHLVSPNINPSDVNIKQTCMKTTCLAVESVSTAALY